MESYSAFGTVSVSSGSKSTPFGFQGGYTDANGLIYLVNRYYDPATSQFMTIDPMSSVTGEPYAAFGDNPVNAQDPLGLCNGPDGICTNQNTGQMNLDSGVEPTDRPPPGTSPEVQNTNFTRPAPPSSAATASSASNSPIPPPWQGGCAERYAASYCSGLSAADQMGLYCSSHPGICAQYEASQTPSCIEKSYIVGASGVGFSGVLLILGAFLGPLGEAIEGLGAAVETADQAAQAGSVTSQGIRMDKLSQSVIKASGYVGAGGSVGGAAAIVSCAG